MEEDIQHVYPISDLEEHILVIEWEHQRGLSLPFCACKCNPKIIEKDGHIIVVHNSFDGRENFEPDSQVRNN